MKHLFHAFLIGTALVAPPLWAETPSPSGLAMVQVGELQLSGAFTRATLPRAPVGGAFLTIHNPGTVDDRLIAATAPVGREVQIHEMAHQGGVMTMRDLPEGLPIPAGSTVTLAPGGYHLMLMGLTEPLVEGETLDITLRFEQAGEVTLPFAIGRINAGAGSAHGGHGAGHSGHGGHGAGHGGHGAGHGTGN